MLGVGGRVVPRFESGRPAWLPPELDWVVGCTYEGHRSSRGPVRNFIGANMSFRRSLFDAIAGFRSDLGRTEKEPAGCEETELCIRATRELGGEMFYEPDAVVHHFVPDARATRAYSAPAASRRGVRRRRSHASSGASAVSRASVRTRSGRSRGRAAELLAAFLGWKSGAFGPDPHHRRGGGVHRRGLPRGRLTPVGSSTTAFDPIFVTEIDVDAPADIRPGLDRTGNPYRRLLAWPAAAVCRSGSSSRSRPTGGLSREKVTELVTPALDRHSEPPPPRVVDADAGADGTTSPAPKVTVVVATRDRPVALGRCLESLARSTTRRSTSSSSTTAPVFFGE